MIDDLLNYKLEGMDKKVVLLSNLEMWKEYESLDMKLKEIQRRIINAIYITRRRYKRI
ncbi:hypothetical protein [Clostridium gasigenes]|uniref:hypothetical protein n=1 Tax=Clostridium gasigenes TaxID=94869 RepID=UPI000B0EADE9|nr:hypothetical protein [Clostridium gasigenes]MBB6625424.1 hypothetical protein [Clostridium gasigenes]MBU3089930.1 hypothetical protein [Clostridium gasigenes]MBU3131891.1 hypothetical protein [Clostridium gasigenes]